MVDDMITQAKMQKLLFFLGWGIIAKFTKYLLTAKQSSWIHFGLINKYLTTVEDKPLKLFCKNSLNARE